MDLDISDILADVSKPDYCSQHPSQHQQPSYDLINSSYTDHQLLVRAWTAERCSPSLLPYQAPLVNRMVSRVQSQISRIEDLTSGIDDSSNTSYHRTTAATSITGQGSSSGNNTNLILSILQTDLSRTQFLLRSYLRQRLAKLTKHAGFYLKAQHDLENKHPSNRNQDPMFSSMTTKTSQTKPPLLSPSEHSFLQHHQALLSEFYDSSFLASFPANLRRLDDSAGGISMVEAPDGGVGVVVRCLREEWENGGEVYRGEDEEEDEDGEEKADVELRFRRGEVWVVRWRDVRGGVIRGDLECL